MANLPLLGSLGRIENVRSQMERIWQEMDHALGGILPVPADQVFARGDFMPAIDVFTKDGNVVVKAELPGFDEKELTVTVHQRQLVIAGERKREEAVDQDGYHHSERLYGKFSRQIALPGTVDFDKAEASFDKGVLTVRVPLTSPTEPTAKTITLGA